MQKVRSASPEDVRALTLADTTLTILIDWLVQLHHVFMKENHGQSVPVPSQVQNYLLFVTELYPQPPVSRRDVVLDGMRVRNRLVPYDKGKRSYPSLSITVPNATGEKIRFVNIETPIIQTQKPHARDILWTMIGFNLNNLASLWLDRFPALVYDPDLEGEQNPPWLAWDTLKASGIMKQYMTAMTNSVVLSRESFGELCKELTGDETNIDQLRTSGLQDEGALRYNAEGEGGGVRSGGELDLTEEISDAIDVVSGALGKKSAESLQVDPTLETARGVDPPRKFQRAKDEKAQDNVLVYAALACAAGAGFIYYA
jgi:hypothetical protein